MRRNEAEFDIIVVGGGPAGSSVATWAARAKLHVALLDRARFPRDKACGEFLTPEACRLLADLGAWDAVRAAGARSLAATVLIAPNGRQVRHEPLHGGPAGYALRRAVLDAVLLENARSAGVEVFEGVAVRELLRDEDGQVIGVAGTDAGGEPFVMRSRLVVGADGTHSLVARQLGLVRALPRLQRVAVVSHWRGVPGANDTIEMRACGPTVCGMSFPGPEALLSDSQPKTVGAASQSAANLTLVVPTQTAAQIAGRSADFLDQTIETTFPELAACLRGAEKEPTVRTVGCFGHVCRPAVAAGALLVGDAATFIDPFTGEGIYFALRGAQLAAEVAVDALRAGEPSLARLRPYHRARRELARRYLLCDIVQAVVRRPALFDTVVRRLERRPDAAERLLNVLGDIRPPADMLHPAFLRQLLAPGM